MIHIVGNQAPPSSVKEENHIAIRMDRNHALPPRRIQRPGTVLQHPPLGAATAATLETVDRAGVHVEQAALRLADDAGGAVYCRAHAGGPPRLPLGVHRRDHHQAVLGVGGGEVQGAVEVGVLAGVSEAVPPLAAVEAGVLAGARDAVAPLAVPDNPLAGLGRSSRSAPP